MIKVDRLAEALLTLTDTLVDDVDPATFLQLVTTQSASMSQSLWAGVLLADPERRLQLVAASTEIAPLRQLFKVEKANGPWLDCFRTASRVVNTDLTAAKGRWPVLVPMALNAGFRSVSAFPLRARKDVLGALTLFSSDPEPLPPQDVRIMQAIADVTTIGLLQERSPHDNEVMAANFQTALTGRIAAEQAKGVVARSLGVTVDAASELIQDYADTNHQHPDLVAKAVLANPDLIKPTEPHTLLTPAEVAAMFRVDPKTITRWAKTGQLNAVRTLGGHRRYWHSEVTRLLNEG